MANSLPASIDLSRKIHCAVMYRNIQDNPICDIREDATSAGKTPDTYVMSSYEPLTKKLAEWFAKPLAELSDDIRELVSTEFFPMPWDKLTAGGRRSIAEQLDCQRDPAAAAARQSAFEFYERMHELQAQIADWESKETPTATDKDIQERRLEELQRGLAQMVAQQKKARGDKFPDRKRLDEANVSTPSAGDYIAYPKAMRILSEGLGATPEELAAWIFLGLSDGIAAYRNANELDPPPRFHFDSFMGEDYLSPMMACWFREDDIDKFEPADRYITGAALVERWSNQPGIKPLAFIRAKIAESRLLDIHPTFGGTQGTHSEETGFPPLEAGLFALSDIKCIEAEDFGNTEPDKVNEPDIGSPEWRQKTAKSAADALHDRPGGSREKHRRIREVWATGKYTSRDRCAEEECAALDMSFSAARKALRNTPDP